MDVSYFIFSAYATTAILIAALCAATWRRARKVTKQLAERSDA